MEAQEILFRNLHPPSAIRWRFVKGRQSSCSLKKSKLLRVSS